MIGTLQQIIPGKVPEWGLALCHIPGTCIVNHQIPLIGIIPLRGLFIIPGKVPEWDLALCHIPGTCIVNHQISLIGIIPLRGLFISCGDLIILSL